MYSSKAVLIILTFLNLIIVSLSKQSVTDFCISILDSNQNPSIIIYFILILLSFIIYLVRVMLRQIKKPIPKKIVHNVFTQTTEINLEATVIESSVSLNSSELPFAQQSLESATLNEDLQSQTSSISSEILDIILVPLIKYVHSVKISNCKFWRDQEIGLYNSLFKDVSCLHEFKKANPTLPDTQYYISKQILQNPIIPVEIRRANAIKVIKYNALSALNLNLISNNLEDKLTKKEINSNNQIIIVALQYLQICRICR